MRRLILADGYNNGIYRVQNRGHNETSPASSLRAAAEIILRALGCCEAFCTFRASVSTQQFKDKKEKTTRYRFSLEPPAKYSCTQYPKRVLGRYRDIQGT